MYKIIKNIINTANERIRGISCIISLGTYRDIMVIPTNIEVLICVHV